MQEGKALVKLIRASTSTLSLIRSHYTPNSEEKIVAGISERRKGISSKTLDPGWWGREGMALCAFSWMQLGGCPKLGEKKVFYTLSTDSRA